MKNNQEIIEWASELASLARESDLQRLEIEHEGHHLSLRCRRLQPAPVAAPPVSAAPKATVLEEDDADLVPVTSEVVGVFRGGKVAQGDNVRSGQLIAYVESINLNQEVLAPRAGQVIEIIAQEGDPVEYGQALVLLAGKE